MQGARNPVEGCLPVQALQRLTANRRSLTADGNHRIRLSRQGLAQKWLSIVIFLHFG